MTFQEYINLKRASLKQYIESKHGIEEVETNKSVAVLKTEHAGLRKANVKVMAIAGALSLAILLSSCGGRNNNDPKETTGESTTEGSITETVPSNNGINNPIIGGNNAGNIVDNNTGNNSNNKPSIPFDDRSFHDGDYCYTDALVTYLTGGTSYVHVQAIEPVLDAKGELNVVKMNNYRGLCGHFVTLNVQTTSGAMRVSIPIESYSFINNGNAVDKSSEVLSHDNNWESVFKDACSRFGVVASNQAGFER